MTSTNKLREAALRQKLFPREGARQLTERPETEQRQSTDYSIFIPVLMFGSL